MINKEGKPDVEWHPLGLEGGHLNVKGINLCTQANFHPVDQIKGSPLCEKNKNLPFIKIGIQIMVIV